MRKPRRLERADRAVLERDRGLDGVVDLTAGDERVREALHRGRLAVQVAREVDDVRHQVAERSGAGLRGMEAPRVERRVVAPVLQVARAKVADLTQLARLDHLPGKPHRRDEPVVERAHVLDAGGSDRLPDLVALVRVAPKRLLADDVLARARGLDRGLGVQRVRSAVVEQPDAVVADELAPIVGRVLVPVALACLLHRRLVASRDPDQLRHERWRPRHVVDGQERMRMGLAHERVTEHPDADLCHGAILRT